MNIKGKNGTAKVFTSLVEDTAKKQIEQMMNEDITLDTQVRIMPDVHAGKGSTVGTTIMADKFERVSPNVVGVDIGCGITAAKVDIENLDLEKLDNVVNAVVPSGFKVKESLEPWEISAVNNLLNQLIMPLTEKSKEHVRKSLGTLGGGNHFVELAKSDAGEYWLYVHSGSRNLGVQVAKYYQSIADEQFDSPDLTQLVEKLKSEGRQKEIQSALKEAKVMYQASKPNITYLVGEQLERYLNDMKVAQKYAGINRVRMFTAITSAMGWEFSDEIDSVHNFIDTDFDIIRKGATSACTDELAIIPINMRDGALIVRGKGNKDWNYSAPHGAGRQMSRTKAKEALNFEDYQNQMKDVYSSSVVESTLDEAPDAYKPVDNLLDNIQDTVEVVTRLKPLYNFKAK